MQCHSSSTSPIWTLSVGVKDEGRAECGGRRKTAHAETTSKLLALVMAIFYHKHDLTSLLCGAYTHHKELNSPALL